MGAEQSRSSSNPYSLSQGKISVSVANAPLPLSAYARYEGFSQYQAGTIAPQRPSRDEALEPRPKKRTGPASHPRNLRVEEPDIAWPAMAWGRRINMSASGLSNRWKSDIKRIESRIEKLDKIVPMTRWIMAYATQKEISLMMTERHPMEARGTEKERRQRALTTTNDINEKISGHIAVAHKIEHEYLLAEKTERRQRVFTPNESRWAGEDFVSTEPLYDADDHVITDERGRPLTRPYKNIWLPAAFEIGRIDANGLHEISIYLPDQTGELREGREAFKKIIGPRGLGYDTNVMSDDWEPHVDIIWTHRPLADPNPGLAHKPIPEAFNFPLDMPLRSMHADLPDIR